MHRHRSVAVTFSVLTAALIAMLLAATAAPAADLQDQLDAKQTKLEDVREREGVLTTTITEYGDEIDRLTGEVATIRNHEAAVAARLAGKQAELDGAVARLGSAHDRLLQIRTQLQRALVGLRERLVAMYESGAPDALTILVDSSGVDDLAARAEYLERIRGMDEAVVGRVRDLRNEAKALVTELREAKLTIESARDEIAAEEQALASARAALEGRQAELHQARATRVDALAQIGVHEAELEGSVAAIQSELAAQLAATGSAPLPAGPIQEGSGGLIWPVNGPITSGFGGRDIGAGYEDHPGVDIGVPEGTPIRAAAAGTVVLQQSEAESGGYGNFTCIDHGGGLSTCYAHQSSFAVSAGDSVAQGEVIGYVGSTGYSTGAHLHFEVRIYGQVTDPMGYL
ncbi:MAG: peptidoglycan DD-metalloendopeptidase family protein [Thermoleophilia bacterium]|nr:peptidoglycan DD-metalloendopeptidase family protein [Thermoleophilia bacterium]